MIEIDLEAFQIIKAFPFLVEAFIDIDNGHKF